MDAPFLEVVDVSKSYFLNGKRIDVLRRVSVRIERGELVSLVGASGSGKSTFLHVVGTLDLPASGTMRFQGRSVFDLNDAEVAEFRELSGGESQRVALARALMLQPALLLADEPTGNLDPATGEGIHGLLREVNRDLGVTAVVVTHNEALARSMPRRLRLKDGQVVDADAPAA